MPLKLHPNYFPLTQVDSLFSFKIYLNIYLSLLFQTLFTALTSIPNVLFERFVCDFILCPSSSPTASNSSYFFFGHFRANCSPASLLEFSISPLSGAHPAASIEFLSLSSSLLQVSLSFTLTPSAPSFIPYATFLTSWSVNRKRFARAAHQPSSCQHTVLCFNRVAAISTFFFQQCLIIFILLCHFPLSPLQGSNLSIWSHFLSLSISLSLFLLSELPMPLPTYSLPKKKKKILSARLIM